MPMMPSLGRRMTVTGFLRMVVVKFFGKSLKARDSDEVSTGLKLDTTW